MQTEQEERTWAMLCHLSALLIYVLPTFGNIIGPLVIWLVQKDRYPLVDDQGKESLNFQISLTIYGIALGGIAFIAVISIVGILLLPVLYILGAALAIFQVVMVIVAAVAANRGERYRYPLTIRFIA
ncbi:MAG: DUF4870 domain-containing protein [Armatimonadota bacterium]